MPAAADITPLVLTCDEEANIARTLEALRWARRVVVLDSGSTDRTRAIACQFPNVDWRVRAFDTHASQWLHGIRETGIETPYVLTLDADHTATSDFLLEVERRFLPGSYDAGIAPFRYCVGGRAIGGSLYPPKIVIARPARLRVSQPGHTQVFDVEGRVYRFAAPLLHDDRKPLERFVRSQMGYAALEAARIGAGAPGGWPLRLRRLGLMAPLAGLLAYLRAGGPFGGRAAARYAYERATFECLLALRLLDAEGRGGRASRGASVGSRAKP